MRAKILRSPNYSFRNEILGKIYEVGSVDKEEKVVSLIIDHIHDNTLRYPAGTVWRFELDDVEFIEEEAMPESMIGKEVMLKPESKWVVSGSPDPHNPTDAKGKIIHYDDVAVSAGDLGFTVKWPNGITNRYDEEDLVIIPKDQKVEKSTSRKGKQKPKRREQTIVYFVFADGKNYEQRRVKGVVVSAEHKAIHVDTERDLGKGLVIRENSTVPFKLLEAVRVSTPDGDFCYYFTNGELTSSAREFNKALPFKTQTH